MNGMALDYLKTTGPLGAQLVDNIQQRRTARTYAGMTYGDAAQNGFLGEMKDQTLWNMYLGEMAKRGITTDAPSNVKREATEEIMGSMIRPLTSY
jgi:hypothetical protein